MKQIDRLLTSVFIGPFIVTFFIALFVLIMQFLWTYIDDIIGKGIDLFVMIELISYLSISLFSTALPIAVLISSVMVMGNMAEKYELASFKSAGVSLIRIMLPLMFLCFGIAIFSFFCGNNLAPVANLKFKSRLYDIRKQKPTLNLEEGVFNDDFTGFVIHIGKKGKDGRSIKDVLIYDHSANSKGKTSQIIAKEGEMFLTEDRQYFVMNLYNGTQYQETQPSGSGKNRETSPFMRTTFKEWNKVFDLSQFDLNRTNEDLFRTHQSMLTVSQLVTAIDSIEQKIDDRNTDLYKQISRYIFLLKEDDVTDQTQENSKELAALFETTQQDSAEARAERKLASQKDQPQSTKETVKANEAIEEIEEDPEGNEENQENEAPEQAPLDKDPDTVPKTPKRTVKELRKSSNYTGLSIQPLVQHFHPDSTYTSILASFPKDKRIKVLRTSKGYVRNVHSQIVSTASYMDRTRENLVKHIYQMHSKFSMALICFIFLFLGAPMGAIVRKGGFGYPILIAILFFMLFIVLSMFCKKLAESFTISAELAAWIPCGVLFPIGIYLTVMAMNDSKIINMDRYTAFFKKVFKTATTEKS